MEHSNEKRKQLLVGVITVSDTRDYDTDKGGKAIIEHLKTIEIDVSRDNYLL